MVDLAPLGTLLLALDILFRFCQIQFRVRWVGWTRRRSFGASRSFSLLGVIRVGEMGHLAKEIASVPTIVCLFWKIQPNILAGCCTVSRLAALYAHAML